jgi:hypothetical protein
MNNLYRFSPIESEDSFRKALNYLTIELERLSQELLNKSLPINTLKVFAHYPEEYDYLHKLVSEMGPKASMSSDTSLYVEFKEKINGHNIKYLGVRIVDPYRLQVGCGDYEEENFEDFKKRNVGTSQFVRNFRDNMIELWHPNYDVLGYVVFSKY